MPIPDDESRPLPTVVNRSTFHEQLEALRAREKAHTREGDAIAAARRGAVQILEHARRELAIGVREN